MGTQLADIRLFECSLLQLPELHWLVYISRCLGFLPKVRSFTKYRIHRNFPIPAKFWVSRPFDSVNQMTLRTVAARITLPATHKISSFRPNFAMSDARFVPARARSFNFSDKSARRNYHLRLIRNNRRKKETKCGD